MGDELIQHIEPSHLLENLSEARANVTLVADKEQSGIVLHALTPRRPPLGGEVDPVIVGIGTAKNLRAVIARGSGKADMGVLGDHIVAVVAFRFKVERIVFGAFADRRPRHLVAPDSLLLKYNLAAIPMLEGDPDTPDDEVATALHPLRALYADPNKFIHNRRVADQRIIGPISEAHEV